METLAPTAQVPSDKIESFIYEMLRALGEDVRREGLVDTPRRVAEAFKEMTAGLRVDPVRHLSKVFHTDYDQLIVVRGIQFTSLCEHHLLPFAGTCDVGYLPNRGKIVGLSKIPRMVQDYAMRPQVQERLTMQVANALQNHEELNPQGVGVVIRAAHLCVRHRGARQPNAEMVTSALLGNMRRQEVKQEFFSLIHEA